MLNFFSSMFQALGTLIVVAVVMAAMMFALWYGGNKQQSYYDEVGHSVYSREAIQQFRETGSRN